MGILPLLDSLKRMGNNCLKTKYWLDAETALIHTRTGIKKSCYGHRRLGSTASTFSGDDIKLVWANNKDSSLLFDKLGAKDIVKRFNSFLDDWKTWQDQETQCKVMLGFDQEKQLMESLCVIPSGMRIGFGYGCTTEEYDFHLDVDPSIHVNELSGYLSSTLQKAIELFTILSQQMKILMGNGEGICQDLTKILEQLGEEVNIDGLEVPANIHHLDDPEQLKEALMLVKGVVLRMKSYGTTIMNYIMQQGHNVDIVIRNKKSSNPKLIVFPKHVMTKIKVREMDELTFIKLNKGEDDEKYIEISFK